MRMMTGPMALFACMAFASHVVVQSVPVSAQSIGGADQSVENVIDQSLPRFNAEEAPLPGITIEFPTQQPPANAGTLSFVLADVAIDGPQIIAPEALRPIYADVIGKEITLLSAFQILARVQAAHREAGFVFTRVVAPPQTIEGGIFKIQVVEAVIGKIFIEEPEGSVGAPLPLIKKIAGRLEGLENPTLGQLEETLLLLNDIPGLTQATAVPRPGDGLGSVDLYINAVRDPFSGVFFADNRQSPILGPGIAGVSFEASSYTAAGDTTRLSVFNTWGDELFGDFLERNILQLEHERHLGSDGTTLKLRVLGSRNAPGDLLERLDIDGYQINAEATVETPLIRTRPLSVWASAGVEFEESVSDTNGGESRIFEDKLRVVYAGARVLQRDDLGYTRADAQIRQGFEILGAESSGNPSARLSRSDGEAQFTLIRGSIERELVIPYFDNRVSVFGSAVGQYSLDPLLSSEEFAAGGQQVGRAYDPSEFTGDSGFGALWELRYQVEFEAEGVPIGAQFYSYADYAEIHDDTLDTERLKSYGGGVRLSLPSDVSLSGEIAIPKQRLQRTNERKPRFFFNLVKRF